MVMWKIINEKNFLSIRLPGEIQLTFDFTGSQSISYEGVLCQGVFGMFVNHAVQCICKHLPLTLQLSNPGQ